MECIVKMKVTSNESNVFRSLIWDLVSESRLAMTILTNYLLLLNRIEIIPAKNKRKYAEHPFESSDLFVLMRAQLQYLQMISHGIWNFFFDIFEFFIIT